MAMHRHESALPPRRNGLRERLVFAVGPTILIAFGATVVASAQSSSPFASQKKTQAWEQPQTAPATVPASSPAPAPVPAQSYTPPRSYAAPATQPAAPRYAPPQPVAPAPATTAPAVNWSSYQPSTAPTRAPKGNMLPEGYSYQSSPTARAVTQQYGEPSAPLAGGAPYAPAAQSPSYGAQSGYAAAQGAAPYGYGDPSVAPYGSASPVPQTAPQSGPMAGPMGGPQQARRSWLDRLGLRNLSTLLTGGVRGGVGARDVSGADGGWEDTFIGDADIEGEISAITDGGLEYGVNVQVRAQYDEGRRGFARRLPDCPPTLAGCASVLVEGVPVALRGHTSQLYTSGPDVADDVQVALESAHLFLRSAYGDVTIGRDDGAAYLFSLGAPTLLNVGASNSPVDYTGLDAVKTVNDASGFVEKITYTSPRLLGDQIGVGVQFGVSYALDANICGVDYCVEPDAIAGVLAPDLDDVVEAGLALDRTFASGLSVEGTLTYARASEQSGLAVFDDLQSYGAGVEVSLRDWTLGGSWLTSNQGLQDGDYEAYDIGLTWQPNRLGVTLGYGHATDDLVNLTSDQFTAGLTYQLRENVTLGAGVQHADRESLRDVGGVATLADDKATAVFIEGGITF